MTDKEIDDLQRDLEDAEAECKDLNKQLSAAQDEIFELEKKVEERADSIADLEEELEGKEVIESALEMYADVANWHDDKFIPQMPSDRTLDPWEIADKALR